MASTSAFALLYVLPPALALVTEFSSEWWKCSFPFYKRDLKTKSPGPMLGWLTKKQLEPGHFCEAALMSPRLAITSFDCLQKDYENVNYVYKVSGKAKNVPIVDMAQLEGTDLAVCLLDNKKSPLPGPYVDFLQSGRGSKDSRRNYAPEAHPAYPASVSSLLLGLINNDTYKLSFSNGDDDRDYVVDVVTLASEADVALPIKPGATFLKELPDCRAAIFGVYSSSVTDFFSGENSDHRSARTDRKKKIKVSVSVKRKNYSQMELVDEVNRKFAKTDRHKLRRKWRARPRLLLADQILKGATLGTLNMNGLSRFQRSMSGKLKQAVKNLISSTDIIAFQETPNQRQNNLKYHGAMPNGYVYVGEAQFGFAYDAQKYQKKECNSYKIQETNSNFLYRCNFKKVGGKDDLSSCISLYTVHLAAGKQNIRQSQLEVVARVMESEIDEIDCIGKVLLGDFNWPNLQNEINIFISSSLKYLNFELMRRGIVFPPSIISSTDNADDPGFTTPAGGEYDFILCNDRITERHSYTIVGANFNTPVSTANDLERHYLNHFSPDHQQPGAPEIRSVQLSDHLPVVGTVTNKNGYLFRVATWNMQNFNYDTSSLSQHRKEKKYSTAYKGVFGFQKLSALPKIQIAAIQEITSFKNDVTVDAFGMKWYSQRVQTTSLKPQWERLGFAYDPKAVTLDETECHVLTYQPNTNKKRKVERPALACNFASKSDPDQHIVVVSVHIVNAGSSTWGSRQDIISKLRGQLELLGYDKKDVVIAGDFNMNAEQAHGNFKNGRTSCPIYGVLGWEFTRVVSKKTLDYLFAPDQQYPGNNVANCYTLHPELLGNSVITVDLNRKGKAFSSWVEISDHFPVFMKFS